MGSRPLTFRSIFVDQSLHETNPTIFDQQLLMNPHRFA